MWKSFIKYILMILILITIGWYNQTMAYLDDYVNYKGLKENLLQIHNQEYYDYKQNQEYKNTNEYKETINNLVKVNTVFDVSESNLEKKIAEKKLNIINKIKTKNDTKVGISEIDKVISKIQKSWKYIVLETPWQMIPINDNEFIYLYPHRILWNVDLVSKIKDIFNIYKQENWDISVNSNNFKEKLIELFDFYSIEYEIINNQYFYWIVKIWKNNNIKQEKKLPFFISKAFTTPYLEENIEQKEWIKQYIWTYISDEEIEYTFNIKSLAWTEVFWNIWNLQYYLWRLSKDEDLLISKFLWSNLDLYVYRIEKNKFEYIIFFIIFILWTMLWILLVHNFVVNYKNNFKKIPEEL